MKKADSSRLETLEALIAEKRRQETFLAKLEERRAGTPEHVFKRLYDEYLTKLTDAQVKAAAEAESLSGGLEDDDAALQEVEGRLAALEEERLEVQLRADVEEWDAKETQKKLTAMTAAISMAEKERDARRAVAERTRALLAEARGGTPAAPQTAVPPAAAAAAPPMRPTTAAMTGGPNFDELAFLNSVVGRASTPSAPAPRESKPIVQPPEAKDAKESKDAEPVAPAASIPASVPPSPAPPPPPIQPLPAPATPTPPATPSVPPAASVQPSLNLETPTPAPAPDAAEEPAPQAEAEDDEEPSTPSPLGRPTPRTSQQVKTLKCAECGSMNYPTEWYCERCGGELAAL
ncbi:hypothetical protein Strain138_001347 [Pseudogemmatithrix spongiicola]|uniref:RanBP2-type domain-containing protein n=1 Tax=Pseudogemmatithrix spongiicola TaxID=3062599 RepID=A0AA49Q7E3_9BACT|nr:hypothetical protein Strain138_001347 [Gemmatimonadaceae bacterium 'strain 138']WKW14982.1 hypothetical protein Strain318_001347 [Gemmatimonadaceae bacterium 'strain 318']